MTLFNIHFPVTLTCDSICVLAEGDLDGCGYVIFLVGKEHGEQSSYPTHPTLSEWGGHNGTLSFGFTDHWLRNHMRFSAAQLLGLPQFGGDCDWWKFILL